MAEYIQRPTECLCYQEISTNLFFSPYSASRSQFMCTHITLGMTVMFTKISNTLLYVGIIQITKGSTAF